MLLSALDIDEAVLQLHVREKIGGIAPEPPEPKRKVIRSTDVSDILPEGHFTRNDIRMLLEGRLSYAQMASRFQQLEIEGLIERVGHGTYAKTSWLRVEREALLAELPDEDAA